MAGIPLSQVALRLRPEDDVVVAKSPIKAGAELLVDGASVVVRSDVGRGHKIAVRDLSDGSALKKYGQTIGFARGPIRAGDHVHVHNVESRDFTRQADIGTDVRALPPLAPDETRTFQGFAKPGGGRARGTTSPSSRA